MAANSGAGLVAAVVALTLAAAAAFPTTLKLERSIPASGVSLNELMARDRARHRRMLASSDAVVNFPVGGTYDPFVAGLYYTKLQLGNPAKDFHVQIDTGSDALWVSCSSCSGCPQTSGLQIPLNSFNPDSSSTSLKVSCSDEKCSEGIQSSDAVCSTQTNLCSYNFQYGDGSVTQGYYVTDTLHLDTVLPGSGSGNSSAPIIFGCSTLVSGQLTKTDSAIDGILGLGQSSFSIISQLSAQGVTPKVFSHCLRGDSSGGGILVLGEIVEPSMVYSPLVTEQAHYNLNLQSISVDGKKLAIDSSVFAASSTNSGTIIDSGTTLAYLAEDAYGPFMDAIVASTKSQRVPVESMYCYLIDSGSSVSDVFPQITFSFEGEGASITLQAKDYLLEQETTTGTKVWCIGFMGIQGGMTILGDLVLKDKIVVYDIAGERIGWTSYDCSMSVNVSTTTNTGNTITVSAGKPDDSSGSGSSSSSRAMPDQLAPWIVMLSLVYGWIVGHRNFH